MHLNVLKCHMDIVVCGVVLEYPGSLCPDGVPQNRPPLLGTQGGPPGFQQLPTGQPGQPEIFHASPVLPGTTGRLFLVIFVVIVCVLRVYIVRGGVNGVIVLVVSVVVTPCGDMNGEASLCDGHLRSHAPAVMMHQIIILIESVVVTVICVGCSN